MDLKEKLKLLKKIYRKRTVNIDNVEKRFIKEEERYYAIKDIFESCTSDEKIMILSRIKCDKKTWKRLSEYNSIIPLFFSIVAIISQCFCVFSTISIEVAVASPMIEIFKWIVMCGIVGIFLFVIIFGLYNYNTSVLNYLLEILDENNE